MRQKEEIENRKEAARLAEEARRLSVAEQEFLREYAGEYAGISAHPIETPCKMSANMVKQSS